MDGVAWHWLRLRPATATTLRSAPPPNGCLLAASQGRLGKLGMRAHGHRTEDDRAWKRFVTLLEWNFFYQFISLDLPPSPHSGSTGWYDEESVTRSLPPKWRRPNVNRSMTLSDIHFIFFTFLDLSPTHDTHKVSGGYMNNLSCSHLPKWRQPNVQEIREFERVTVIYFILIWIFLAHTTQTISYL